MFYMNVNLKEHSGRLRLQRCTWMPLQKVVKLFLTVVSMDLNPILAIQLEPSYQQ